ncbi:MAG: response regulator [Anaerolineae bacterium]
MQTSTLVVARPGLMCDSLLIFLQATHGVEVVAVVDDLAAALEAVRRLHPHTLVVDADLPSEEALLSLVQQIHAELPALNIVAVVNSFRQQRAFLAAGAGHALLKGCLDERLRAAVVGVPANAVDSG